MLEKLPVIALGAFVVYFITFIVLACIRSYEANEKVNFIDDYRNYSLLYSGFFSTTAVILCVPALVASAFTGETFLIINVLSVISFVMLSFGTTKAEFKTRVIGISLIVRAVALLVPAFFAAVGIYQSIRLDYSLIVSIISAIIFGLLGVFSLLDKEEEPSIFRILVLVLVILSAVNVALTVISTQNIAGLSLLGKIERIIKPVATMCFNLAVLVVFI